MQNVWKIIIEAIKACKHSFGLCKNLNIHVLNTCDNTDFSLNIISVQYLIEKFSAKKWFSALEMVFRFGDELIKNVQLPAILLTNDDFFVYKDSQCRCRHQLRLCDIVTIDWLWCYSRMST